MIAFSPFVCRGVTGPQPADFPLPPTLEEVLNGMLLGDAYAQRPPGCRHVRIQFQHSVDQKPFVDHLFTLFQPWTRMPHPSASPVVHRYRTKAGAEWAPSKTVTHYRFQTRTASVFDPFRARFYTPNGSKRVPGDLATILTPRALAYHLMCDGSQRHRRIVLHTEGFTRAECATHATTVNRLYGVRGVRRTRTGRVYYQVQFPVGDFTTLEALLRPHLLPHFSYKLAGAQ